MHLQIKRNKINKNIFLKQDTKLFTEYNKSTFSQKIQNHSGKKIIWGHPGQCKVSIPIPMIRFLPP